MNTPHILIIGAAGQLGYEFTQALRDIYDLDCVIASDIRPPYGILKDGIFEHIDALNKQELYKVVKKHNINCIYHLAATLSAKGEQRPLQAWSLNMQSLLHVLELSKEHPSIKVCWPSSIAVFGPDAPKKKTPQHASLNPTTVYGISKLAGEQWCAYYHKRYNVDVRSIRYPGLIGPFSQPGGGTTDYAVDIYNQAKNENPFECFLAPDCRLPMMYMKDAIQATLTLMNAPKDKITVRSSYNVASMSFNPAEIASVIQKYIPSFSIVYKPDFRQQLATSWPQSIDGSNAYNDWGWEYTYDLERMTLEMLSKLHNVSIIDA